MLSLLKASGSVPQEGVFIFPGTHSKYKYIQNGADAFGVGSPLFNKHPIREKDWAGLKEHCKKFADLVTVAP